MNDREFLLRVSVLEIYNEKVYDLLSQKNDDLRLREDSVSVLCIFKLILVTLILIDYNYQYMIIPIELSKTFILESKLISLIILEDLYFSLTFNNCNI